jgi:hypothetical protein
MATTALFTAANLNALPSVSGVTADEATAVEAVVWGWLKPILNLIDRPDPVSPELFSWALELGAIYRTNPAGLSRKDLGPFSEQYSSERRDEILRTAAGGGTAAPGAAKPLGSFPAARAYPDPAERY